MQYASMQYVNANMRYVNANMQYAGMQYVSMQYVNANMQYVNANMQYTGMQYVNIQHAMAKHAFTNISSMPACKMSMYSPNITCKNFQKIKKGTELNSCKKYRDKLEKIAEQV